MTNTITINIKIPAGGEDYIEMLRDDIVKVVETLLGRDTVPTLVTSEIS